MYQLVSLLLCPAITLSPIDLDNLLLILESLKFAGKLLFLLHNLIKLLCQIVIFLIELLLSLHFGLAS